VDEALALDEKERREFLDRNCSGDENLRCEVESLLAFNSRAQRFLERPALEAAAAALAKEEPPRQESDRGKSLEGQTFSHYHVLRELGSGGMGVVYEAVDVRLRRRVALKFLPEDLASDSTALQRFEREARAASSLNHPSICTIYEVEEFDRQPVIVMELLEGKTLKERIGDGPVCNQELLEFGIQLSDALAAAHARGIIHRDLKPGNIFDVGNTRAKILDFGLAKVLPVGTEELQEVSLTQQGAIPGTTPYMSPEQARGDEVDTRTDLFSLGVVLFELATGQRPFARKNRILTIDAILNSRPPVPSTLNPALPAEFDGIIGKALEKDRERRYQHASELRNDLQQLKRVTDSGRITDVEKHFPRYRYPLRLGVGAVACLLAFGTAAFFYIQRTPKLTDKDTIVLADFTNRTGDPIFDETLKQGMAVQLGQSPYLSLISEERIQQTLSLMGKPIGTRLDSNIAREVCERTGSTALLEGSIASLGSAYVLGLRARHCRTGNVLDQEQSEAAKKEDVLKALTQIAGKFRARAGESLATLGQHDIPLEQATTPSLEALKAYSAGIKTSFNSGFSEGIPLLKRALEIDPRFALAYAHLGLWYSSVGESMLATESTSKAYQLRDRASDRERFFIQTMYDRHVTGNLERAYQTLELWVQTYPRDIDAHGLLSGFCAQGTGRYEQSIQQATQALAMDPGFTPGYINISFSNLYSDRFDAVEKTVQRASQHNLEVPELLVLRYYIALLQHDRAAMQEAAASATGKPEAEDWMAHSQAIVLARSGRLKEARTTSQRAIDLALQAGQRERAASYQVAVAVYGALLGDFSDTRRQVKAALELSNGRDVEYSAAFALAWSGQIPEAVALLRDLESRFPEDNSVRFEYVPTLKGLLALDRKQPEEAVQFLQSALPHELAVPAVDFNFFFGGLYSAYVRGQAYLTMHRSMEAVAEFQKILNHRGLVAGDPIGALAHLQLARAYAVSGDKAKTKSEYQEFLALWKDADPDLLPLKQARGESAKMP
jgi:serine/threonine protein kinase/tetratricopeptide (TPR) repeat protein